MEHAPLVFTKGWEVGLKGGQGVMLKSGKWSPETKLYGLGLYWLLSGRYTTKNTQKAFG